MNTSSTFELLQQAPSFFAYSRGPDHVFELANEAYFRVVGRRDIIGKPVRLALPEIVAQGFVEFLDQATVSGEAFVARAMPVKLARGPGGALEQAYSDFIMQPIRDASGAVVGILHQGHEVTGLVRAEERYREVLESIDDGFCILQMIQDESGAYVDYRYLEANPAFEKLTGLTNVVGKRIREMVPDLGGKWEQFYGEVVETGVAKRLENYEPAMQRWFSVHAHRIGDPAEKRLAVVFQNTTERKAAEAAIEKALADEQAARQLAEDASRTRDNFLAVVSHELRTPLSAMLGWVQLLRAESLAPEKYQKALETIERNARAQAQLIEDLLDVSRVISGKLQIEMARVILRPIVEAALETVRPSALAKEITLEANLSSGTRVLGDAARLQQIVVNLLTNAVKFTPNGGRIDVTLRVANDFVELTVADTGKGISPEFLPKVFDRFRQEEQATTRRAKGLGLGLSIVRELVEMHKGTVAASSVGLDQGATFTVRLPLAATRETLQSRPLQPLDATPLVAPPELQGLRLLLLEDEVDTRDLLETLFTRCGARVTTAGTGAEALAAFQEAPPDLFISDIGLPGEDGYAVIAKVRALPRGQDVPAIALTAYARDEDRARALASGFDAHTAKPVEPREVLASAAAFARRKRS